MKVKCKKILTDGPDRKDLGNKTEDLTVDNEYIVLCVSYGHDGLLYFQFEGDNGQLLIFEADQFEVLSTYIPSSWEIELKYTLNGRYCLNLSPRSWNSYIEPYGNYHQGFYEAITEVAWPLEEWRNHPNEMPDVVKLFFQGKDLIHREEEAYWLKKNVEEK